MAIVRHPVVQRLGGLTQLGLLNLVYPTATHTRLEHSLGTYSTTIRYLTALYQDPINPLFKQIMGEEDLEVALLVALLHDIGHYALAHDLEEAEPAIFSHEKRTLRLLGSNSGGIADLIRSTHVGDKSGFGLDPQRLIAVLEADPHSDKGTLRDRILHSLIDGPIDADLRGGHRC
jgi:HD superfamily phosphohydrolase